MSIERTCPASHVRKIAFFVHENLLMFVGCTCEDGLNLHFTPNQNVPHNPKRPRQLTKGVI
jgi:hypothetical protein